jgi:hypothetical protein
MTMNRIWTVGVRIRDIDTVSAVNVRIQETIVGRIRRKEREYKSPDLPTTMKKRGILATVLSISIYELFRFSPKVLGF